MLVFNLPEQEHGFKGYLIIRTIIYSFSFCRNGLTMMLQFDGRIDEADKIKPLPYNEFSVLFKSGFL